MPNTYRNQISKSGFFIIFLCVLLWNLGAGVFPTSIVQDSQTITSTNTQSSDPEVAPLTETPTESISTASQSADADHENSDSPPMPAIFSVGSFAPDELVVRFKGSTSQTRISECFQGKNIQVQSEIEELKAFVLRTDPGEVANTFYLVLDCPGALYVEPNFLLQAADTIPNDPSWPSQYGLVNIRAPQGWDLETGSNAITIAIVDSGVDYGHPDLAGKLLAGYDFVNNDDNPQDDNGHGTHVAGIAAASSNNAAGIAGVSWGARILPVKVLNSTGGGTFANTAAGVVWAVDHGAQVINLSLGGNNESAVLKDAIDYAHSKGAVVVAAAGNTGSNFVLYPARYPNVIAVARTDSANQWSGSNFGPEIDLSAPGISIYSTIIGGYDFRSGSSMSTGFVSGLAAVLMGIPGNTSPDGIEYLMEATALDIEFAGWDEYTGAGLIQMDAAILLALQPVLPPENSGNLSIGDGAGSIQVGISHTPTPTWTVSLTPFPQTPSATFTPEFRSSEIASETMRNTSVSPVAEKSEVEAQDGLGIGFYILPCTGLLLILLGIMLLWVFRKSKRARQE